MNEALLKAINTLFKQGDIVEVRGKLLTGRVRSKFVNDPEQMARLIDKANSSGQYEAIWVTLQRLRPDILSRHVQGEAANREDIQSYEWLIIDIDRPSGDPNKKLNATTEELYALKQIALSVRTWLTQEAWPKPVLACSGNGWHLLYKLPSLPTSRYELLKAVLKAINKKFSHVSGDHKDGRICKIDTSLAEPEQVCKIYGTTSRKSPKNEEPRPWRESFIEEIPEGKEILPVSEGLLIILADEAPVEQKKVRKSRDGVMNPDWTPYDFFEWADPYIKIKEEYEDDGVQCYVAETCCLDLEDPMHEHHNRTVYRWGNTFGIVCFADQHEGMDIGIVLKNLAILKGEPYPGHIWLDDPDGTFGDFAEYVAPDAEPVGDEGTFVAVAEKLETTTAADFAAPMSSVPEAGAPPLSEVSELEFPADCLYGRLGDQAKSLNVPRGYAYPAMLGAYSVEPEFDEMGDGTRINMYVAIAGGVGSGKNEAMKRAVKVRGLTEGQDWKKSELASNRGLMNVIGERIAHKGRETEKVPGPKKFLLRTNEIVAIFKKGAIDNSTLFEMLCDFWDENEASVPDKKGTQDANCRLSWMGGLPIKGPEDFAKVFGKQTSFGLMSRFIFGYSTEAWEWQPWDAPVKHEEWTPADDNTPFPAAESRVDSFSEGALKMMEEWKPVARAADPSGRLLFNAKKVALLTASANGDKTVGAECMARAIKFMNWQIALRSWFKPSEANTDSAAFGEKVMRHFEKVSAKALVDGKQKTSHYEIVNGEVRLNWKRIAHDAKWAKQDGAWMLHSTMQNLLRVGELVAIEETDEEGESTIDPKFNLLPARVRLPRYRK